MLVNTHLKTLVDSPGAAVFEAGKTCRHWVHEECIKVCTRVPKTTALEWLTRGLPSAAVLARDFIALDQLAPFRKVWVPDRSALLNGSVVQILQSLRLALAGIPAWAVVRAPTRWGVQVHKDQEQACKAVLQPHVVFVPDSHHRFCVRDLPRDFDPESIVATLATETFKPYLVSNLLTGTTARRITLASSTEPADIVFAIKDAGGTVHNVLLEKLAGPAAARTSAARRPEEGSPTRKSRRAEGPERPDLQGGSLQTRFDGFHAAASDFPALLPARVARTPPTPVVTPNFPNQGNTCYAAVVLQVLLQLRTLSITGEPQALQFASLRQVLTSPTHDNWQAFLSALGLGGSGSPPEDAALFLESLVEPEPALRSRLELVEELTVECIGCGDHRVLRRAELVHRVTAPSEPTDLQSLLLDDFARLDEEREVSCPQCFASTAVSTARTCRPGQALFIQIRRGGVHATKNTTPVSLQALRLFDTEWSICAVICHKGPRADDGHYIVLQADPSQPHGWLLKDDSLVRAASSAEVAARPVTCSIVMLCPCAARAPEPIVDPSQTPPDLTKSGDEDGLVVSPPAAPLPGAVAQASLGTLPRACAAHAHPLDIGHHPDSCHCPPGIWGP